jgi:hypothetical protein
MRLLVRTTADIDVSTAPPIVARAAVLGYETRTRDTEPSVGPRHQMEGLGRDFVHEEPKPFAELPPPIATPFWAPIEVVERETAPGPMTSAEKFAPRWRAEPSERPRRLPLADWPVLAPRLRTALAPPSEGRELNLPKPNFSPDGRLTA